MSRCENYNAKLVNLEVVASVRLDKHAWAVKGIVQRVWGQWWSARRVGVCKWLLKMRCEILGLGGGWPLRDMGTGGPSGRGWSKEVMGCVWGRVNLHIKYGHPYVGITGIQSC